MFSYLLIIVLIIQSVTFTKVKCDLCPSKGKIGGSVVPDVLLLTKGQSGFKATIEIITPEEEFIMISESYNGAKKFGQIVVDKLFNGDETIIYYYASTNEKYEIENDVCISSKLELLDKYNTIGTWLVPDLVHEQVTLFGDMDYLGPTVLMVWARSVSDKAQYIGTEKVDGRSVKHWFHCFNENIWVDFWFDEKNNSPFRFSLSQSSSTNTTIDPHVYNYLIFNPMITSINDVVPYPVGYGCTRSISNLPKFPSFMKSETFSLDMEAVVSYSEPERVTLSSAHLMKYQATYSFEINDSSNQTIRIIQNPEHRGRYFVDTTTGLCALDNVEYKEIEEDNLAIKWPFYYDAGFNLLQAVSSTSGAWSNYMGQVITDAGLMDVWEDGLYSFFSSVNNVDSVVTYYFPAIDRSSEPHQAPVKIVIKPINSQYIPLKAQLPYQIEIVIIDYDEKSDFELSDKFDVSGCYDGPGEFTWFQLVMADINPTINKDLAEIRTYFQKTLGTFIPAIRIPEIVVNIYDFSYYITCKLLERPPFIFNYEPDPSYVINNPTSILIRDSLEDCGDLCTNDLNCKEFSYCSDATCQIFSSSTTYTSVDYNKNCTWYRQRALEPASTLIERNILASTRSILSQIKSKINNGELLISKYSMSVEDMFIVSGPEEVGGIEEELKDYQVNPLKGDEYTIISPKSRLITTIGKSSMMDISYSDCLKLCQNDDDCYTLSYCNNAHRECTLSIETKANLTKNLKDKTSHADNCNIFEKSFVALYRKFPGQSLVKDSEATLFDTDESECARICYESTSTPCKSFDYCLHSTGAQGESIQRACFLHKFHAVEDTAHEISDKIWDFSTSTCDHYAVKLSRDYVHYIGRQYKTDRVTIISEIADVSMERCAADCNQVDNDNCISFEYCESIAARDSSNIRTTCRLSSTLTTGVNDLSSLDTIDAKSTCSVYLNKDRAVKLSQIKDQDHFGLALGLGSVFFILAFSGGVIVTIYYQKNFR